MSDEPQGEGKEAAAGAAGGGTSKPVLLLLVVNLGLSGFAAFKVATAKTPHAAASHGKEEKEGGPESVGQVINLDPFIVNLNEPGASRYLKVTIQLELQQKDTDKLIEKSKQLIRDDFLSYLSGLSLKDCLGGKAKDKIRTDLLAKIDDIIGTHRVKRMFFQDFVVQ